MEFVAMTQPATWLATGAVLGIIAMALVRRLQSWREQRSAEWDPY